MPSIPVNLGDIQAFEAPALGKYEAEVKSAVLKPAQQEGKFDQLQVTYTIIEDGPELGSTASEWLSFSPKAAFRMKKYFDKYGLGDLDNMDFDDDTDDLTDPDIVGTRVVIESYEEADNRPANKGEMRQRIRLVEVLDEIEEAPAPKRASRTEAVKVEADEPEEDDEEEEEPAPRASRRVASRQPARAAASGKRSLR